MGSGNQASSEPPQGHLPTALPRFVVRLAQVRQFRGIR